MGIIGWVVAGVVAYLGFVAFLGRMLSDKWHPDGGIENREN